MEALLREINLFMGALTDISLMQIVMMIFGTLLGIIVGAIPGLTATMALALLIGISYKMELPIALAFLLSVYVGAVMGGCNSAIMLNIPGTPNAAATALDGFPLAKQGKGGLAIGVGVIASFFGMLISITALMVVSPLVNKLALEFKNWEFFLLALFGIMICGNLASGKQPIKGWIVGFLGFFTAMIGLDAIYAYPRFTMGMLSLQGGIALIPALVGVFGISEVLDVLQERVPYKIEHKPGRIIPSFAIIKRIIPHALRSGLVGIIIGAIPGAGEDIGAWVSYDIGKRRSKEGHKFGTGAFEGLASAETANNAVIGGAMIPLLALAVPGSPPSAMFLAAIWLHGVRPGPMLNMEFPGFLYTVAILLLWSSVLMLIWGLALAKPMVTILRIKREILMPIVVPLTVIGAYASGMRIFDIYVMFVFGLLGYALRKLDYPMAPLVLGIILGPMADISFRRALMQSRGSLLPLLNPIERPLGFVLLVATIWMAYSGYKRSVEYRETGSGVSVG